MQHGEAPVLLSDNALFNFGKYGDDIVVIDAGSRSTMSGAITKGDFNEQCMKKFWTKVQHAIPGPELDTFRAAWRAAPDMNSARNTFDRLWAAELIEDNSAAQPVVPSSGPSGSDSAEQPALPKER